MDAVLAPFEEAPLSRRRFLNFLTGSALAVVAGSALYPLGRYLIPPPEGSAEGSALAKDKLGNPIPAEQILAEPAGTRALVSGLAGEPTYLTVKEGGSWTSKGW